MDFLRTALFLILAAGVFYLALNYFIPGYLPSILPEIGRFKSNYRDVRVGSETFRLEIADTEEERTKGLSGRINIKTDEGMLFLFDNPDQHGIWMKGMRFPLDIIWLKDNWVVDFLENIPPDNSSNPRVYRPRYDANAVIEVPAGTIERVGLGFGDYIDY